MFESSEMEDNNFVLEFKKKLSSSDKFVRRTALLDARNKLELGVINNELMFHLLEPIFTLLSSEHGDSLRETASQIFLKLALNVDLKQETLLDYLRRMEKRLEAECSEEIRRILIKACHAVIIRGKTQEDYLKMLDAITKILKLALKDKYGEVVREACEIIITLGEKNEHFHLQADFFVEPLLHNFKSLQMKTRASCVRALCPILIHAPLTIPNILSVLEKTWFESSPQLKLMMIQTVGTTSKSIEFSDQSYHLLLPILLLGLCHDYQEVSGEAEKTWAELKAKEGFEETIEKSLKRLISKLLVDSEDWNTDMRCQTAQLMYRFIFELPNRQTELSTVMEILTFQAGDEVADVRQWALKSARLLGESVPKKAFRWLLKRETSSHSDVAIYSQLAAGFLDNGNVRPKVVALLLELLIRYSTLKESILFDCVDRLLAKDVELDRNGNNHLLLIILSLEDTEEQNFTQKRQELLEKLALKCNYSDAITMIQRELPAYWKYENPEKWNTSSVPWRILLFIAGELRAVDGFIFDLLCKTVETTLSAEIRLKSINMLTAAMDNLECEANRLQSLLVTNLKWKPGRSASILRYSIALCALTALKSGRLKIDEKNADAWVDALHYLIEDELTNTRLITLKILKFCLTSCLLASGDKIIASIMGRLNDISKEVRKESIVALRDVFLYWKSQGKHLCEEQKFVDLLKLLLNDEDETTRSSAEGALNSMLKPCDELDLRKMKIAESAISPVSN